MFEIQLAGCRPEPLLSYLKALGVLRLVAEQKDMYAHGAWTQDVFVLQSSLDEAGLLEFLQNEYRPTPIVAPWAGGSGFFGKDNTKSVDAITRSETPRLEAYRTVIKQVQAILKSEKITEKPKDEQKVHLLRLYRRKLPDVFLEWMDCAIVLQADGQAFPPITGTGGNDGRFDFTQNFMQRLADIGITQLSTSARVASWLKNALFADIVPELSGTSIGQFDPGHVGGPNATQGFEGSSQVNPWDYVLMLEGALLLAGSATRRLGVNQHDKAAFPFTVNASAVGQGALLASETGAARGEIWLPLWSNFTGLPELRLLFAEGRAQLGGRQARDAVDFARAIAGFGVDSGVTSFTRYAFLRRSGKSFLATPLGRFDARPRDTQVNLLSELDHWLAGFKSACDGKNAPARFGVALHRLEAAIFNYCRYGDRARFGSIVCALGQCERELGFIHDKPGQIGKSEGRQPVSPVPLLSPAWLAEAQENSPEFRLALSLVSIRGYRDIGPFRTNLEPVAFSNHWWSWDKASNSVVWSNAALCNNLRDILDRRLMEATRSGLAELPLSAKWPVRSSDISSFIHGEVDDARLEEWLWGLMLIDLERADNDYQVSPPPVHTLLPLPRPYALLKLLFLSGKSALHDANERVLRPEPAVLNLLRAGNLNAACQAAARRLHASGYIPLPGPFSGGDERRTDYWLPAETIVRLPAALLFPLVNSGYIKTIALRPAQSTRDIRETK